MSAVGTARPRSGRWILMAVLLAAGCGALAAEGPGQDHTIGTGVSRFMLSYSGVFALIALTAAVAAGLVATDNIVMATLASDLMLLILVTGVARRRFAAHRPATWRAIHAGAYLGWPLAIVHGLPGGRPAKPYVDSSYGACLAAVAHQASQHYPSHHYPSHHRSRPSGVRHEVEPR
jgi:hypothetical protein